MQSLRLFFHPRKREGSMSQRHPTLEEHVERIRREYTVAEWDRKTQQRNEALLLLDDMGGVSVKTDAKRDWDRDDDPLF